MIWQIICVTFYLETKILEFPSDLFPLAPQVRQRILDTFFRNVTSRVQVTLNFRRWITDLDTIKYLMREVTRLSKAKNQLERPFGNVADIVEPSPVKLTAPFGQIEIPALAHMLKTGDVLPIMMAGDGTKQLVIYPPPSMDVQIEKKLERKFAEAATKQAIPGRANIVVFDPMQLFIGLDNVKKLCDMAFREYPILTGVLLFNYLPREINRPREIDTVLMLNKKAKVPLHINSQQLLSKRDPLFSKTV